MPLLLGNTSYFAWKKQTAFGTKATLTSSPTIAAPMPDTVHFRAKQFRQNRFDHINPQPRFSDLFTLPKIVEWGASFLFYQDVTLVDFLCAAFGIEVRTGVGAPFTHKWYVSQPLLDGGSDPGSGAGTYQGRALTLGHAISSAGFGWEIENAVVDQLTIAFEQSALAKLTVSGTGANKVSQAAPAAFAYPASAPFNWADMQSAAGPPTAGIFATAAAAPGAPAQGTNDLVLTKMNMTLNNNLLIQPSIGGAATQQYIKPERDGYPTMTIEVEGLADYHTSGTTMDFKAALDAFINAQSFNLSAKASVNTNSILEFQFVKSSVNGVLLADDPELSYNGDGIMRWRTKFAAMPAVGSTDAFVQLTSSVS